MWTGISWFRTHLSLREPQVGGQLGLASDRDVATVVELLLKLQPLMVAVHDAVLVFRARLACNRATLHYVQGCETVQSGRSFSEDMVSQ